VSDGGEEARLDLSDEPLERVGRQAVLAEDALGRERRAEQAARQQRRVALRLARQRVVAVDDFQARVAEVLF